MGISSKFWNYCVAFLCWIYPHDGIIMFLTSNSQNKHTMRLGWGWIAEIGHDFLQLPETYSVITVTIRHGFHGNMNIDDSCIFITFYNTLCMRIMTIWTEILREGEKDHAKFGKFFSFTMRNVCRQSTFSFENVNKQVRIRTESHCKMCIFISASLFWCINLIQFNMRYF